MEFFWLAVGIALMGYFIGDGLKYINRPKKKSSSTPTLIKEEDLPYYVQLTKKELEDLFKKHPNVPKIKLDGKNFYHYEQFCDWLDSEELYKDEKDSNDASA